MVISTVVLRPHGVTLVTVEPITAVYAKLENRPSSLARIARVLGDKRLNIDALSVETNGAYGFARIVTARPKEAVEAIRAAGAEAYESQLLVWSGQNRPGELARATAELGAAEINVEGIVTTADGRLAIRTSDNERAAQILRKL